jgi:hypothetical protein
MMAFILRDVIELLRLSTTLSTSAMIRWFFTGLFSDAVCRSDLGGGFAIPERSCDQLWPRRNARGHVADEGIADVQEHTTLFQQCMSRIPPRGNQSMSRS